MNQQFKPHDGAVEVHPVVHFAQLHIADDVVNFVDPYRLARDEHLFEAGHEHPAIAVAIDEGMDHIAVGVDRGDMHFAVVVFEDGWLLRAACAAPHRLAISARHIVHLKCNIANAVPVLHQPVYLGMVCFVRGSQHKADVVLLEHITGFVAHARLQSSVCHHIEAEHRAVKVGCLLRVADKKPHMVNPSNRHNVHRFTSIVAVPRRRRRRGNYTCYSRSSKSLSSQRRPPL